jgi:hypothetical protein
MRSGRNEDGQRDVFSRLPACERTERERELLRLLVAGEGEIAAGMGYTLASILKEADAMLVAGLE